MSYARVESLDSLQALKVALVKFSEASMVALADAESEVSRTMMWLENEQTAHWQNQIRKRQQIVERCKEALRSKKIFKDAFGRQQSTIDEEKALRKATLLLEEAELKYANTRKAVNVMRREQQNFKGGLQRFHTCIEADVPAAVAQLSNMLATLKQYVAAAPAAVASQAPSDYDPAPSMARAQPADPSLTPQPPAPTPEPPKEAGGS
jgi:hypothetical protein